MRLTGRFALQMVQSTTMKRPMSAGGAYDTTQPLGNYTRPEGPKKNKNYKTNPNFERIGIS